jgi:transcriptional regulator with XRE-family HTH domain
MSQLRTHIGDVIRRTRKALRMSQMQLAEKVGISYQQIQKYEKGQSEITLSRLYQICNALGVDPLSLLSPKETCVAESLSPYRKSAAQDEIILLNLFRKVKDKKIKEGILMLLKEVTATKRGKS